MSCSIHPVMRRCGAIPAWRLSLIAVVATALIGCNHGGDDDDPAVIGGTAAADQPVVGTVTVKDSTGRTRTTTIQADGKYRVDVSGLVAPFVFLADGSVGGRRLTMASAATADDIGQTINVTPFTDLIVANLAGEAAQAFFESPRFAALTKVELDAARQTLTRRLLPVLQALGVADGFDVLRSSFAADRTGFDAALDVLRVSVDPAHHTATIRDLVNQTQIVDDLASRTDDSAMPVPAVSLSDAVAGLRGIDQTLAAFSAAFADGLPASDNAALRALMAADFLDWGGGVDAFLSADGALTADMVGVRQSGASLVTVSEGGAAIDVEFVSRKQGQEPDTWQMQFRRGTQGTWQYAGNRRSAFFGVYAINARFRQADGTFSYRPYVEAWVTHRGQAAYALLQGPGLGNWAPTNLAGLGLQGVVLGRSGSNLKVYTERGLPESSWIPDCVLQSRWEMPCVQRGQIPAGATYTLTLLDGEGNPILSSQSATLAAVPAAREVSAAAGDASFPRIASIDPATKAGLVDGKRIRLALVPPTNPAHELFRASFGSPTLSVTKHIDAGTRSVDVGVWSGPPPQGDVQAVVKARDALDQQYASFYFMH